MKKFLSALVLFTLVACNSGGIVSGPSEQPTNTGQPAVAAPAATPAPVAPVNPPEDSLLRVNFYPYATFEIFNDSKDEKVISASITSFDNQEVKLAEAIQVVGAGKSWNHSFGASCVQLDTDAGNAFFGKAGQQIDIRTQKGKDAVEECRKGNPAPQPTPTPSPEPTPTPTPSPSPSPEPTGYCYYEVTKKPEEKQKKCEDKGGEWGAWYSEHGHDNNQCRFSLPGISDKYFNLNPGQSAQGCLSKHEED